MDFNEVFEYKKDQSVFIEDDNDRLINAEDGIEETSIRELDFDND